MPLLSKAKNIVHVLLLVIQVIPQFLLLLLDFLFQFFKLELQLILFVLFQFSKLILRC